MYLNILHNLPDKLNSYCSVYLFFFYLDLGCCFSEAVIPPLPAPAPPPRVVSVEDKEQTEGRGRKADLKHSEIYCWPALFFPSWGKKTKAIVFNFHLIWKCLFLENVSSCWKKKCIFKRKKFPLLAIRKSQLYEPVWPYHNMLIWYNSINFYLSGLE